MSDQPAPTIWHTIPQAADVMGLSIRTIRKWIADGDLPVKAHPLVPGAVFVDDRDLLKASATVAARRGGTGRFGATTTARETTPTTRGAT